jgi:hypothetical protein
VQTVEVVVARSAQEFHSFNIPQINNLIIVMLIFKVMQAKQNLLKVAIKYAPFDK